MLKNINLGAAFLFLSILCSMKIERLLFLKFLKNLAFFESYFWPFNKSHEKSNAIFVISTIMASIWNVFIKFRWHDEKLTLYSSHHIHSMLRQDLNKKSKARVKIDGFLYPNIFLINNQHSLKSYQFRNIEKFSKGVFFRLTTFFFG